jgi:hypothetical protein
MRHSARTWNPLNLSIAGGMDKGRIQHAGVNHQRTENVSKWSRKHLGGDYMLFDLYRSKTRRTVSDLGFQGFG